MIRPAARAAALLIVAPFLAFVSALAPQHVHEPGPGHDDEHAVAHSHFAPHQVVDEPGHDHDHAEFDHNDEHVVWLDGSTLHEAPYQLHAAPAGVPVSAETVRITPSWSVTSFDDAAPVHGPPRPASPFRGPPSSRRLS